MANLNQKIEIVVIHYGELVHIVTGFLGGLNHEWKIDRKAFERFIDTQGKRSWSLQYVEGSSFKEVKGKMTWEEYYADIRAFEDDTAEFIGHENIESLIRSNKI